MKRFEEWYKAINEELGAEPTAVVVSTDETPTATESPRDAMIQDVDTIMTSLETLAAELTEELQNEDLVEINEDQSNIEGINQMALGAVAAAAAVGGAAYIALKNTIDYTIKGPKAAKTQAKVDALKIKAAQLEAAIRDSRSKGISAEKRAAIEKRIEQTRAQASEAQDQIDTRYENSSEIVKRYIANQKVKTKIQIAQTALGEADGDEAADLKDTIKNLNQKLDNEKKALQELKPSEEEQKKAAKQAEDLKKKQKEKEAAAKAAAKAAEKGEETPKAKEEGSKETETTTTTTTTTTKSEPADTSKQDAIAAKEADIKAYNDNIETEKSRIQDLAKQLKDIEAEKAKSTNPESYDEKIANLKKGIEDSREDIQQMKKEEETAKKELSKMSAKESLMYRSLQLGNEILAEEIATKQDWQLAEGTALYNKYNTIIRKAEMDSKLNESISLNIKDRFSKLI